MRLLQSLFMTGLRFLLPLILSAAALAQSSVPADVPATLKPPVPARVLLQAHANGHQIYSCVAAADGNFAWTLKAPQADLRDANGKMVITHSAGPKWQHNDGSSVTGKVRAKENAPDTGSIPWLLLEADNSQSGAGVLSNVSYIQRIHTEGGQPPATGCDASHKGDETKVIYAADYVFFAASH
jgi:hypothetical protein